MKVERCDYFIPINQIKPNGQNLSGEDLINIGYMAGRYGINLDGDLNDNRKPEFNQDGVKLNINCCTADLFEENLNNFGITFEVIA